MISPIFCPNILPILISFAYLVKRPWNAATSRCRKWCIYWRQTWTAKRPLSTNWRGNFKVWPILGWDISKPLLIKKVRTLRGHLLVEKSTILISTLIIFLGIKPFLFVQTEISISLINNFLKPHKISAHLDNLYPHRRMLSECLSEWAGILQDFTKS